MEPIRRVNVLGVGISALEPLTTMEHMVHWIEAGEQHYVCVCAVHIVLECQNDPVLRAMVNSAGLAVPDGMPLAWIAWLRGQHHVRRVYGPDLMLAFCQIAADRRYRTFLLGGAPGQDQVLAGRLTTWFPHLPIVGTYPTLCRPMPADENDRVVELINRAAPDVVWVGMGAPFQERWMAENRCRLDAPVLAGVGAAFDIHTGWVRQAPDWIQQAGLEWFVRLAQEPRRLWRRYLLGNPIFVWKLLGQCLGLRKYEL